MAKPKSQDKGKAPNHTPTRGDRTPTVSSLSRPSGKIPSGQQDIQDIVHNCILTALGSPDSVNLLVESLTKAVTAAVLLELQVHQEAVQQLQEEIKKKDEEIRSLHQKIDSRTDDISQYQRRNCLRFFGIEESRHENCEQLVLDIASKQLKVNLDIEDLDRCHRTGRNSNSGRPRPIIVKFVSYRKRSAIFKEKSKLKGTNITIREDLTKHRLNLLQNAISLYGTKNVWTYDGRIIIKTPDGTKHTVISDSDLNELCEFYEKKN